MNPKPPGVMPTEKVPNKIEVVFDFEPGVLEPEETKLDLFKLIHERIRDKVKLVVSLLGIDSQKSCVVLGYHPYMKLAFLSAPLNWKALFVIDPGNKALIVDFNAGSFRKHRDAFMYRDNEYIKIKSTFENLLQGFIENGYSIKKFAPNSPGEDIIFFEEPGEIPREEKAMDLSEVVNNLNI